MCLCAFVAAVVVCMCLCAFVAADVLHELVGRCVWLMASSPPSYLRANACS